MTTQANQLFSVWTAIPSQQYVQGEVPKNQDVQEEKAQSTSATKEPVVNLKNSDVYKAGNVILAVLDTEVNSDEASPVMATIVQGSLKGSKVIGNFQLVSQKLLLKFSVVSIPRLDGSVAINAVAIDPETSKTAMASSVDNHYMLRYGTLLGSAFLSGLGQAVQTSGTTVQSNPTQGNITQQGATSTLGKTIIAVGTMAQAFGTAMGDKVNTPPTVKLNAGVSVGLLLMADLAIPKKKEA